MPTTQRPTTPENTGKPAVARIISTEDILPKVRYRDMKQLKYSEVVAVWKQKTSVRQMHLLTEKWLGAMLSRLPALIDQLIRPTSGWFFLREDWDPCREVFVSRRFINSIINKTPQRRRQGRVSGSMDERFVALISCAVLSHYEKVDVEGNISTQSADFIKAFPEILTLLILSESELGTQQPQENSISLHLPPPTTHVPDSVVVRGGFMGNENAGKEPSTFSHRKICVSTIHDFARDNQENPYPRSRIRMLYDILQDVADVLEKSECSFQNVKNPSKVARKQLRSFLLSPASRSSNTVNQDLRDDLKKLLDNCMEQNEQLDAVLNTEIALALIAIIRKVEAFGDDSLPIEALDEIAYGL